jgi:predicted polyphosphate/ATP-dependent NAD kinase
MRIGLVVNPVAGMGGRVGLKGTDGMVERARAEGAQPRAGDRAREALVALRDRAPGAEVVAAGGAMGADPARAAGFDPQVAYGAPADPFATTAGDTRAAVEALVAAGVDLLLFAGGDGTAVDVARALEAAGADLPVLGIPAGVKIYSGVFGATPAAAGRVAAGFDPDKVEDREVNDIDETAFRDGRVETRLEAVVRVPVGGEVQSTKQVSGGSVEALAAAVADDVRPGVTYVLGPGGTMAAVKRALGVEPTPLGVDVYRDGDLVAADADEAAILATLGEDNVVVVSPIGGQGFVFGRGNQQISPAVIRRSEVEVVASRAKLDDTGVLRVDTGDPDLDEQLRGWRKVRVGRVERRLLMIE